MTNGKSNSETVVNEESYAIKKLRVRKNKRLKREIDEQQTDRRYARKLGKMHFLLSSKSMFISASILEG